VAKGRIEPSVDVHRRSVVSTTLMFGEKSLAMKDLDRRVSVAPMMDWSDDRGSR
jgi:hypothetical protein